ncbi:TIGR03086 family metal-binding protein [Rhodococcus sp. P1Y]|uniref:TIGR03086 family metal-binding protein n=1 Tax=Rhodococcus sp. P1Y TaxID=1302308 RepID=UPI000EB133B0|nr:TIGR03086 family metal-binding protein [Rhodococcus sp. P1Y]AYJ47158.1 TIGR03086 family protein [Rhodococcus sp. P1Y]
MTNSETTADRYRRLASGLTTRIDAVPSEKWDIPSTCDGWSVRDVVRHIIDTEKGALKPVGLSIPDGPTVDDDPAAAWAHTRDAMQEILDDPARANLEYDGHFGRTDLASSIGSFYSLDLIVHAWDVAHPAGVDSVIDGQDLDFVEAFIAQMGDNIRMEGVCGPAVEVPEDSDRQTKVLAQLGRDAASPPVRA